MLDCLGLRLPVRIDHISGDGAPAEGHQYPLPRTGLCGEMVGYAVGERVMDRQGHGHRDHLPAMSDLIFLDSGHGIF